MAIKVTVWGEFRHEKSNEKVLCVFPEGMHEAIAAGLPKFDIFNLRTATLDKPEHGLTDGVVNDTELLM